MTAARNQSYQTGIANKANYHYVPDISATNDFWIHCGTARSGLFKLWLNSVKWFFLQDFFHSVLIVECSEIA
jgi:hypothetical protein